VRSNHVGPLLRLAAPLILSGSTITILQAIDAVAVGHHSEIGVAAMGPSSLAVILVQGLLFGTSGYAGTLAATAHGAGDAAGVRRATWLGIRFALWTGLAALLLAWPLGSLFGVLGHAPAIAAEEMVFFRVLVAGSVLPTLSAALSGWLAGVGRTRHSFHASLVAFAVASVLSPALVLGWLGLPRLGLLGAALATLAAQACSTAFLLFHFHRADGFRHPGERRHGRREWSGFLGLALPQGLRIATELLAWTAFLAFVGRLGAEPLAASSIAFRINGLAFFPALGLGQAAAILAAQARGAGRLADIRPIAWQALLVGEVWMGLFAAAFVAVPAGLLELFGVTSATTLAHGVLILRFVAGYSLFDAANVILASVLAALGDTRWTLVVFLAATSAFLAGLFLLDHFEAGTAPLWSAATVFVFGTAIAWVWRFERLPMHRAAHRSGSAAVPAEPVAGN